LDKDNTLTVSSNLTKKQRRKKIKKALFLSVLPITLLSLTLPLSQVVDCSIIIRSLSKMRADAKGIYGVYSGSAMAIINLPVTVCFALATVAVPAVAKRDGSDKKSVKLLLLSTLVLSILGALCCYIFSPLAVRLLFSGFSTEYKSLTVTLIRATSLNVIFSAMLQTINSILIGVGKTSKALVGLLVGVIVKTLLTAILINFSNLGILVMPITVTLCNSLACFINLLYIKKYANKKNND
jgi:O-antigen/teichoic acid export membrane protein